MARPHAPALLINDGSLPALLGALASRLGEGLMSWVPPVGTTLNGRHQVSAGTLEVVRAQAERLAFGPVLLAPSIPSGSQPGADPGATGSPSELPPTSRLLLEAVLAARTAGCCRLIWPVVVGRDPEGMVRVLDQAMLVGRLAALDGVGDRVLPVETPLAEYTPAQLADLADDLDAPLDACEPGSLGSSIRTRIGRGVGAALG